MTTELTAQTKHEIERKVGQRVICNGYPGTITRVCEWSDSMVEVRISRGTTCVDFKELLPVLTTAEARRLAREAEIDMNWILAGKCWNLAADVYPYPKLGALAEADIAAMRERAQDCIEYGRHAFMQDAAP